MVHGWVMMHRELSQSDVQSLEWEVIPVARLVERPQQNPAKC